MNRAAMFKFRGGVRSARGDRAAAMQRVQWGLGVAATLLVALVWWVGLLDWLENPSIDLRARTFASSNAEPSSKIVVVAIDDAAIENVGRWPWDRSRLALIIDEMRLAGAGVIALDLLLDNPQVARPVAAEGGGVGYVQDDEVLGAAMKRHGRVISAVSFRFNKETADDGLLRASFEELYGLMRANPEWMGEPWEVVGERVIGSLERFRNLGFTKGKEIDRLRQRWEGAVALMAREGGSSVEVPEGAGWKPAPRGGWATSVEPAVPVKPIADGSLLLANVTFDSYDADGLTRRIPLLVEHNGRLWPTLGLAAGAEFLTGSERSLSVEQGAVVLRDGQGVDRRLSISTQRVAKSRIAGMHIVSWPRASSGGGVPAELKGWERQFYSTSGQQAAEVAIGRVYEPARLSEAVKENWGLLRAAVMTVLKPLGVLDAERERALEVAHTRLAVAEAGSAEWNAGMEAARPVLRALLEDAETLVTMTASGKSADQLSGEERDLVANLTGAKRAIGNGLQEIEQGVKSIASLRAEMKRLLGGKVCFVGWTATGSLSDFVATSIDPRTPGVHLHAAVCNSLLTGFERVPGPVWGQLAVLFGLGLIGTWIGVRASVVGGPLLVVCVVVLWGVFSAVALWGLYDRIWGIAGPSIAAAMGWLVVVLHRLLVEQRARRKTEERFKSYVSPAVVDILVANPSLNSMAPQQRELTVFFSDIAGFTSIAERLGSKGTAELLATYLGSMTETIQRHGATLDKYIGDAIVAFWGAPVEDSEHARHGCSAAVELMNLLERLNQEKAFGEGVSLHTRIGLATGDLMVGDFGNPPRNSSYTVIGDTANLGSRLEGANKVFGTRTLVSDRTRQLAGEGFLWRSVGTIKVKGKAVGIRVHELLAGEVKGEQTADWIALSEALVADYQAERLDDALAKALLLREQYHDEVFASAYGEAIAAYRAGLVDGAFDGSITLTEK